LKDILNKTNQNKIKESENIENEILNLDLSNENKIIPGIQNNQIDNEIKRLVDEIVNLKYQLVIKDNEIKDLKLKIQNNNVIDLPKYNLNEIMVINFISPDSSVNEGIKCLSSDVFAEVEEKLYKKYNHLRNTNNMFKVNEKPILRFKKLCENGIKDGDKIQILNEK